ncbi:MAG: hypothetical protein CM15mP49_27390 [Actinomycetota bacterium]|nr:MAG: hypothetical protein CM15mP49_27390 [Actinomycetota bacterium]
MGNPTPFVHQGKFLKERRRMAIVQKVNEMIEALLLPADIEIYDIELNAGILKVTINSEAWN